MSLTLGSQGRPSPMPKTFEREKLLEAIAYFTTATKHVGVIKLFKLLYYLDMLHFRETGRSVTSLTYHALPYGPVPTELYKELNHPAPDLSRTIDVRTRLVGHDETVAPSGGLIRPLMQPSLFHLTKREQRILAEIAEKFRNLSGAQISDISHARNGPWDAARKRGQGKWGTPIKYLDSANLNLGTGKTMPKGELAIRAIEYEELRSHFA